MVKIVVIFLPLFFFSCKHQQSVITTNVDSLSTYHDTIISIAEKHDTFYFPALIIHDTILINKNKSALSIKRKENKIEFICKEDEYKIKLDSVIRLKQIRVTTRETIIHDKCKSEWHSFLKYFFWIVIALVIIRMLLSKLLP